MKSIKQKILIPALVTMMAAMMITTTYSTTSTYKSTMSTLDQTMTEAVKIAAGQSSEAMGKVTAVVTEFADTARLKNSELSDTEKQAILNDKLKLGYFESISMTKSNGISLLGINLADRDYIQYCLTEKKPYITDPFFSQELNKMTIVVAAPSFVGEQVVGVVYGVMDANYLSSITDTINVGETGTAYMVNSQGVTIAYNDESMVLNQYNTQAEALNDPDLLQLAALEAKMVAGEVGFGTYTYGGVGRLMAFAPIPNTHGWSIAITAAEKEFMQGTVNSIMVASALLVVFLLLASFILFKISNSIANPIKQCAIRLKQLAEGDLSSPVAHFNSKDETGMLAAATESIVDTLNVIISDEDYLLGAMANGDFDIRSRATDRYVGDFQSLLLSIRNINTNLSNTLSQINEAADQVSGGSDQVSDGAQALSQGATEQASSIEELSATITEIASQVKANAGNAANAKNISLQSANEVENGNRQMQQMISAMAEISSTSGQIGKIIKTIEDIAFQTNILALNAAVEAARAGAAGKGFAVVADEVRNLAGKSAEAAKGTTELIQSSIKAVENGTKIADSTAKSLNLIVESTQQSTELIEQIASASNEQADAINQVTMGVDQISSVVQTNSATSEESAAASEELNSQAQMLKTLVGTFKLKKASTAVLTPAAEAVHMEPLAEASKSKHKKSHEPQTSKY